MTSSSTGKPRLTREEQAKIEIGHTRVSTPAAVFLTAMFLLSIAAVPLAQFTLDITRHGSRTPSGLDACAEWRGLSAAMAKAWMSARSALRHFLDPNAELLRRINAYTQRLDDTCFLTVLTRPWVQAVMCRLGVGNEKAILGRDGWLFYEPDVRHLTAAPFLSPRQLHKRSREGADRRHAPQPDPVKGIVHFRDQLAARGLGLVVVPAPVKPSVEWGPLAGAHSRDAGLIQNESYSSFLARLETAGVHVFDCSPVMASVGRTGRPRYLKTDTHWRPEVMRQVCRDLAAFIEKNRLLPPLSNAVPTAWVTRAVAVRNAGDIAAMLKLPAGHRAFPPEEVTIQALAADPSAENAARPDVLLLGDSFANIYSLADMGWGENAGMAEQLGVELRRPVERLVRNDAGACATREMLALDLARGADRLAGKRLVVWEFATRELSIGDWKLVELAASRPADQEVSVSRQPASETLVGGRVADVSDRPASGAVYKDFVMKLYVTDITDDSGRVFGRGDGVVHLLAMRDRKILPIAATQKGDRIRVRIQPWQNVEARYGSLRSGSLSDAALEIEKDLYWAEPP